MRRLMLFRHAKTEHDAPSGRDQDRRLDNRGRHDAAEIGGFIGRNPPFPALVLVSHAVRAHQTWEIAWEAMKELLPASHAEIKVELTPELKDLLWTALLSLATAPQEERTLTGLSLLLQSNLLKAALQPYTLEGPFGALLDASEDQLSISEVHCFETETLMGESSAILPVLTYLFHRLEETFDGSPTLLVLDEAWVFLDHPLFAARIREWLKVLRKKNVAVLFATQSLADIAGSTIAPAIIESCPQRILLPNDRAIEPQARAIYESFGLNARQVELVARATPKRQYYLQSARGNRLFELGLGPIALALCATSDPATQSRINALLEADGTTDFAARFLASAGLDWAAELLGHASDFPSPLQGD